MVQESGEAHMTDASTRIWAWPHFDGWITGDWSANTYHDERAVAYILAAEHDRIVAEKDAEIAAARDKALEDAATLANNRIRRWLEIEPPYNGDLDEAIALIEELPAAIRAMKGGGQTRSHPQRPDGID